MSVSTLERTTLQLTPFEELSEERQLKAAEKIAAFTHEHVTDGMIAVEPDDILRKPRGLVALDGDTVAGYVGAAEPIPYRDQLLTKVGSLCVLPQYTDQGLASELISNISGELQAEGQTPFAFCNPHSLGSFERAGYSIPELGELPPGAVSTRDNQPVILET